MRSKSLFVFLLSSLLMTSHAASANEERYAVYYSDKAPISAFGPYQTLVLDARYHPPLQPLKEQGKLLLGYISLGEVDKDSPWFRAMKEQGLLLNRNENWDSSTVDIRSSVWQRAVIEDLIPAVLREGFDGIFFDTLDSPLDLERRKPERYAGMEEAAVQLVQAVRMHYPELRIMVNRAYPILPRLAPVIDMALGESVYADYDFERQSYSRVPPPLYHQQVEWLQQAKAINPNLKVYTLDYAKPSQRQKIAKIYRIQRENGFIPYVATIKLNRLVPEPRLP